MNRLKHCMCGCIYEKDRVKQLETALNKAERQLERLSAVISYHSLYTYCVNKLKEKKNGKLLTR